MELHRNEQNRHSFAIGRSKIDRARNTSEILPFSAYFIFMKKKSVKHEKLAKERV